MVKSNTGSELFSLFEKIGKTPAPSDFKGFTENPIRDDVSFYNLICDSEPEVSL